MYRHMRLFDSHLKWAITRSIRQVCCDKQKQSKLLLCLQTARSIQYRSFYTSLRQLALKGNTKDELDKMRQEIMTQAGGYGGLIIFFAACLYLLSIGEMERIKKFDIDEDIFFTKFLGSGEVKELLIHEPMDNTPFKDRVAVILQPGAVIGGSAVNTNVPLFIKVSSINEFEDRLRNFENQMFGANLSDSDRLVIKHSHLLKYLMQHDNSSILLSGAQFTVMIAGFVTFFLLFRTVTRFSNEMTKIKASTHASFSNKTSQRPTQRVETARQKLERNQQKGGSFFDMFGAQMRKARYTLIDPADPKSKKREIRFSDIAGADEAKTEVMEIVDYLKRPEAYTKLGGKLPKGCLLLGPPGCGKTLMAKAVAFEANVPFLAMAGSDFVEMIGGLGASRVRALFRDAKQMRPCIIFIDEIDAVGRKRAASGSSSGGGGEDEQTLNQLLVEMDGMDSSQGLIILGATNRADILDKALLRPGRFDRHITIDLPTIVDRVQLFNLYLKKIKLDKNAANAATRLAQLTPGMSGADIANVVNEAAISAATSSDKQVEIKHLNQALSRVIAGTQKRTTTLSPEERERIAYHECGHALVAWMLETTDALLKVSIIPRTAAALGFAQYSPVDRKLYSKEMLHERMCMALGGRAAENYKYGNISTGAEDDLKKVTKIANDQVKIYGMSEKVGLLSFPPNQGWSGEEQEFSTKPYSQNTAYLMDLEVNKLVTAAYRQAESIITDNKCLLEKMAKKLLENEELTYEQVRELIGDPPHGDKQKIAMADPSLLFPTPDIQPI